MPLIGALHSIMWFIEPHFEKLQAVTSIFSTVTPQIFIASVGHAICDDVKFKCYCGGKINIINEKTEGFLTGTGIRQAVSLQDMQSDFYILIG